MQKYSQGELLVEVRNHVAHLTLNRPAQLNPLSFGMLKSMSELFAQWAGDDRIKAIVLRGAGSKAFCAGGDIRSLRDSALANGTLHRDFFIAEYTLDYQLHRYVKPYISLLDGIVMGGGMGIAQGSGFRVAGPKMRMAMPETGIGLFPDVGASYFLSRARPPLGFYLGLTGTVIGPADALFAGLADRYLHTEAISELDSRLDRLLWTRDPGQDMARLIDALATAPPGPATLESLQDAIALHFSMDNPVVEIVASLERETRPQFMDWARTTAALLKKRSPTLLEVTHEQLNRGASLSLADSLRMELGLVFHCFEHGDLMEGIRAVIIDKDNAPRWHPQTLADLDRETVADFFKPRWEEGNHPLRNLELRFG